MRGLFTMNQINRLFHYTTFESALKIIESCTLKASNPKHFNDPFECQPNIKKRYSDEELDLLMNQHIEAKSHFINKAYEFWEKSNSQEPFVDFYKRKIRPQDINYQEMAGNHFRLISCSGKPNVIPMWAHYAGNHTGVVIEFELETMPFAGLLRTDLIQPVKYSQARVFYDHIKNELDRHYRKLRGENKLGVFLDIATTKDISWRYEEEIRIVLPLRFLKVNELENWFCKIEDNLFMKLQEKSFKAVYCGMRMPGINQKIIQRLLKAKFLDHSVPIKSISPSDDIYDFLPFSIN